MYAWFCFNGLATHPDTSETILFSSCRQCLRFFSLLSSIAIVGTAKPLSDTVKTVGVLLDSKLKLGLPGGSLQIPDCLWHKILSYLHFVLWALVHSMPLLLRSRINCHSLFVAQSHFLPSKSDSQLTISPWHLRNLKFKHIVTGGCLSVPQMHISV